MSRKPAAAEAACSARISSSCRLAVSEVSALANRAPAPAPDPASDPASAPPPIPFAIRSSDGFLSKPLRPEPPSPDCMLVSGKLPTPDLLLSVLSIFAVFFCCDDWVSPPDCTDFLEQPETPRKATLATSAN